MQLAGRNARVAPTMELQIPLSFWAIYDLPFTIYRSASRTETKRQYPNYTCRLNH